MSRSVCFYIWKLDISREGENPLAFLEIFLYHSYFFTFFFMKQILLFLGLSFVLAGCTLTQSDTQTNTNNTQNAVANIPLDGQVKFDEVKKEVEAMKQDGMNRVKALYPDLQLVKSVKRGDKEQLAMMGDEEWMYSTMYDTTIVVCKDMNTPAHVFRGKTLSDEEFIKVRKMHEDMMKMMD